MYARIDSTTSAIELLGDAELVRLLKLGREEALDVLLHRHRDALYRFCCHLMTNREDAEDICQETLARAMTRVDSLQAGSAFRSWLFSIARNLSVDSYRSKKRTCPMPDEEAMPLPLYGDTPQDRIETSEEHQIVVEALGKLAQSHQRVLVLREVDGLSYAAIAERMQVSQSAVETLLFRARRRLREEYSKSAVPVIAVLNGLRDLATRLAGPVASGPIMAKIAVTTALVGTGAATTGQISPWSVHVLQRAAPHHAAMRHHSAPASQAAHVAPPTHSTGYVHLTGISRSTTTSHRATVHVALRHHASQVRHVRHSSPPAPPRAQRHHAARHHAVTTGASSAATQASHTRAPSAATQAAATQSPRIFAPAGTLAAPTTPQSSAVAFTSNPKASVAAGSGSVAPHAISVAPSTAPASVTPAAPVFAPQAAPAPGGQAASGLTVATPSTSAAPAQPAAPTPTPVPTATPAPTASPQQTGAFVGTGTHGKGASH